MRHSLVSALKNNVIMLYLRYNVAFVFKKVRFFLVVIQKRINFAVENSCFS